jgi:hypothetical protein
MFREAAITVKVGQENPRLDALLEKVGQQTAACIRAGRESVRRDLAEALEERGYVGMGEGSVLVVGMGREVAREIGLRLRQRAVIFHRRGERTELVFVG